MTSARDEYFPPNGPASPAQTARIGNDMRQGHLDVLRALTVLDATTETVVSDPRIRPTTVPLMIPLTSAAANVVWWLKDRGKQSITIGHDAPSGDQAFTVVLIG